MQVYVKLLSQTGIALFNKLPDFIRIESNSNSFKNRQRRLLLSGSFNSTSSAAISSFWKESYFTRGPDFCSLYVILRFLLNFEYIIAPS